MFVKCLVGCFGIVDEVVNVVELLMSDRGVFIMGVDFLIDGGVMVLYFYGLLKL